jgi:hypothetical protein
MLVLVEGRQVKMKRAISILVIVVFLFSIISVPVRAVPSVTNITDEYLNPISWGVYGKTVYVFGDGITSGAEVNLYWDSVQSWDGEKGLLNSSYASPSGAFEVWFQVPETVNGSHYLWFRDTDMPPNTFGPILFSVKSVITASPNRGLKNDPIILNGYGFGDEANIDTIEFDGSPLSTSPSTPVADSVGSWMATFDVPDKADGEYNLVAQDDLGNTASVTFNLSPTISLDTVSGSVGAVVEVSGRGFTPFGTVNSIKLDDVDCKVLNSANLYINSNGRFTFQIVIPSVKTADMEYTLKVGDNGGKNSSFDFYVILQVRSSESLVIILLQYPDLML